MNVHVSPREEIQFEYDDLPDGVTKAGEVCPSCKGGYSKEGSLSVTSRGGLLLFTCHRASCGFRGAVQASGKVGGEGSQAAKSKPVYPRIKVEPLNAATVKLLAGRYRIPSEVVSAARLGWSGDAVGNYSRRVAFPISGPDFEERGKSYRSFENGVQPKAIIELRSPDDLKAGWYKWQRKSKTLVIVEDPVSAIKLAPHTHVISLFGTHIPDALVEEIKRHNYEAVFISLDKDAVMDAIKMQIRLRKQGLPFLVMSIEKDVKDMDPYELKDYLDKIAITR